MSENIQVILENFTTVQNLICVKQQRLCVKQQRHCNLELKLSFDGEQHYIEEAWLDGIIDFYTIADKYGLLDKLLEEALKQLKLDKENAKNERGYIENLD